MADTIRWCFTCHHRPLISEHYGLACVSRGHDVADAVVIRKPINYEAAARTKQNRSHAANTNDPLDGYYPPWEDVPKDEKERMTEWAREEIDAALGGNE